MDTIRSRERGGGVWAFRPMDGDKALGPEVFNMAFFKHY